MALGIVADIHGNRIALEAVVADARDQGVDRWWVLGDLVAVGPDPVDTLCSVSNPITDDRRTGYVVVHADRHGHRIEHRLVSYDHEAFLRRVDASGHPAADFIASFQRGEQSQYPAQRPGAPLA